MLSGWEKRSDEKTVMCHNYIFCVRCVLENLFIGKHFNAVFFSTAYSLV